MYSVYEAQASKYVKKKKKSINLKEETNSNIVTTGDFNTFPSAVVDKHNKGTLE